MAESERAEKRGTWTYLMSTQTSSYRESFRAIQSESELQRERNGERLLRVS